MGLIATGCWFLTFTLSFAQLLFNHGPNTSPITTVATTPIIDLGYVRYVGALNDTSRIISYRGIPYAQPPLGDLRWRTPQPIENKNNFTGLIVNASLYSAECVQAKPYWQLHGTGGTGQSNILPQSEDCLILNVLVPQSPMSRLLPVVVAINPGGYDEGSTFNVAGDSLVHASNGSIIYVEMQYRLNMYGFLAGSKVMRDGEANAGLLDQRLALEWVQRHIESFGGDPERVTVWGASAGGGSVTYQLTARGGVGKPPFRSAIVEYPWWQSLQNSTTQDAQYHTALQLANCSTLACLRSLPPKKLALVTQGVLNVSYYRPGYAYGDYYFGPVLDHKFVRELPDEAFKRGNFHKVPIMIDHDDYEGILFTNLSETSQVAETTGAEVEFPFAGPSFFSRLYQLYPRNQYNSTAFQRQTWFGDSRIRCPTYYMATSFTDHNANSSSVFKLFFAAGTEEHGATAPFLTSPFIGFPDAPNATLAEIMSSYWISFIVHEDPNPSRSGNAPFWPSYRGSPGRQAESIGEGVEFNVLDVQYTQVYVEMDQDASAQCDFFSSQGHIIRN